MHRVASTEAKQMPRLLVPIHAEQQFACQTPENHPNAIFATHRALAIVKREKEILAHMPLQSQC
jgi:hypothetical protein